MKRLIKFERGTIDSLNTKKYVLVKEYEGFGIYEGVSPNGYHMSQYWFITNNEVALVCDSYNNFIIEELLDAIDSYNEKKSFGVKGFYKDTYNDLKVFIAHPNKNMI